MSISGENAFTPKNKLGVSVVIPTYNRKALLEKTLLSLSKQLLDKSQFEVIVVDDGSSDGTDLLVKSFQSDMSVQYFFQEDLGFRVAQARNIGINVANFSVILFIDSGVIVSPRLLQKHLELHDKEPKLVVIGLSHGVNEYDMEHADEMEEIVKNNTLENALLELKQLPHLWDCRTAFLNSIQYQLNNTAIPWILFWTSHVSVSSAEVKAIEGFDEWFQSWGGEDVELGLRLHQAGCIYKVISDVESIHYPHPRDGLKNRNDSKCNVKYIHKKHQMKSTESLLNMNWEELVKLY